jgi:hypothetical protein
VFESTGKSVSIVSTFLIQKLDLAQELEFDEEISQKFFLKVEEVIKN